MTEAPVPVPDAPPENAPPPGMPPADEAGFPQLPMFGGECNELFGSVSAAQSVFSLSTTLRNGVTTSGMAMLSDSSSQAQVGTQLVTSYGAIKADLISAGMLQASFEGFSPLPFLQTNLQLAFVPQGLAGGVLQSMMLTPVGMLMGAVNTGGQMVGEIITGGQPTPTSQVLLGMHWWGLAGTRGGFKAALEVQHAILDAEENMLGSSAITVACTAPFVQPDGTKLSAIDPTLSLSVFQRTSPSNSMAASIVRSPKDGTHLSCGGTRQLSPHARLRGKYGTTGVLALALELAGEKSSFTIVSEAQTTGDKGFAPKFGATLSLSP